MSMDDKFTLRDWMHLLIVVLSVAALWVVLIGVIWLLWVVLLWLL
jgi:hypothetical protein